MLSNIILPITTVLVVLTLPVKNGIIDVQAKLLHKE